MGNEVADSATSKALNADPGPFRWRATSSAQRRTLLAAYLGWMLDGFDVLLYSLVLATLMRQFGMSQATAGLLNSLTLGASALGSLLFGVLADRFGRRRLLTFCILTYSVFTFACGLATNIPTLAVLRFLLGLGMGGEWGAGATLVAETWPSAWRGRALGIVQSSWAIGYALAAITAGAILGRIHSAGSWRWVFFVGVIPALVTVWIQRRVPEPELWQRRQKERLAGPKKQQADETGRLWKDATPRLLLLLAMNTFGMFAWWGLFSWIPAYLVLPVVQGGRGFAMHGLAGATSLLVLLNLCGMLPGYLIFGFLADAWGRKRTLVIYLAGAALAVPFFAAARQPAWILVTASVAAYFGTGFFTGSGIVGSELFPTPIRAAALGISYNAGRGLSALAPYLIGRIGQARGLSWAFGLCGAAFACAMLVSLVLPETHGTEFV